MRKERIIKFCKYHVIILSITLFLVFIYKCPLYYFYHIPCPGCGITRAHIAAMQFDFKKAFEYHPMFFIVIPTTHYIVHRDKIKYKLNKRVEILLAVIILVVFIATYIFRLLNNT